MNFLSIMREGGVVMGKMKKDTKIKKELERLDEIYKELPENKYKIVYPLLENAAFMKVTLEDLQYMINKEGCHDEYKNGANQYGRKASADLQAYNSLIKNYNSISERLEKMLPPEKKKSKLDELIKDG